MVGDERETRAVQERSKRFDGPHSREHLALVAAVIALMLV